MEVVILKVFLKRVQTISGLNLKKMNFKVLKPVLGQGKSPP